MNDILEETGCHRIHERDRDEHQPHSTSNVADARAIRNQAKAFQLTLKHVGMSNILLTERSFIFD